MTPSKTHIVENTSQPSSSDASRTQCRPPSPFTPTVLAQSLCDSHLPTAVTNPLRYTSTPSTLPPRATLAETALADLVGQITNKIPPCTEVSPYPTRLGRTLSQRRRSADITDRMAPTRTDETCAIKYLSNVRSESHTPNIPRTAFSERLLIARKAVDEGKLYSLRPPETENPIHPNLPRRMRDEVLVDHDVLEPYAMNEQTSARGAQVGLRMPKDGLHELENYGDLPEKSEMTPRSHPMQAGQQFAFRQRAISTDPPCYYSRSMPVQVVKPAIRQTVALDSSGHDTGSPSDSTASMKSDERLGTFDPDQYKKRLSADVSPAQDDRMNEQKPKSALVTEHKRTQRQHKYDKTGG